MKIVIAQMLGCLISWGAAPVTDPCIHTQEQILGFQQVLHEVLSGWRIMFLVLGCVTAVAGVWTLLYMPDSPMEVSLLTEAEKRAAIERVKINQTGIKNTHFKWKHLKELVADPQIWLLTLLIIVVCIALISTIQ